MSHVSKAQICGMLDLSVLKPDKGTADLEEMVDFALRNRCAAVFTFPCYTGTVRKMLPRDAGVALGGVVGFPSGMQSAASKSGETAELIGLGCDEIDMVINIGKLKEGDAGAVEKDIRGVVSAAGGIPVKVILECHYLDQDDIVLGCRLSEKSGAKWVKTGTGWAPTGATPARVALMKQNAGKEMRVKAAGGISSLAILLDLYSAGAERFGIGLQTAIEIIEEVSLLDQ